MPAGILARQRAVLSMLASMTRVVLRKDEKVSDPPTADEHVLEWLGGGLTSHAHPDLVDASWCSFLSIASLHLALTFTHTPLHFLHSTHKSPSPPLENQHEKVIWNQQQEQQGQEEGLLQGALCSSDLGGVYGG